MQKKKTLKKCLFSWKCKSFFFVTMIAGYKFLKSCFPLPQQKHTDSHQTIMIIVKICKDLGGKKILFRNNEAQLKIQLALWFKTNWHVWQESRQSVSLFILYYALRLVIPRLTNPEKWLINIYFQHGNSLSLIFLFIHFFQLYNHPYIH